MFPYCSLVSYFTFHHFLKYSIFLVDVSAMDEVAPSDEDNDQEDYDADQDYNESHGVLGTLV